MNYYLNQENQTMGPFPGEQLKEFFEQGKLDGSVLCCAEGGSQWRTIAEVMGGTAPVEAGTSAAPLPAIYGENRYTLRRKVLTLFGATFHVFTPAGTLVFFSKQKAFKLREDIRIYADESMQNEILAIRARQVMDFSAAYDVVDSATQTKIGALRRKGFTSLVRDAWLVLDSNDREVGQIQEDSMALALIRRFVIAIIPQKFHLSMNGRMAAHFQQQFNPFVYKLEIQFSPDAQLDKRMGLAAAILLAAVEGRQG